MKFEKGCFLCPECGGNVPDKAMFVSPVDDSGDPAGEVQRWISCAECGASIPAHLAERWDDMSIDEARAEWRAVYQKNQVDMEM